MGKKNKGFKEKLYSIPRCKILVILNPWGSHGHPTFANNIGGWFERMLQDEYPGKCINMIFTRPSDTVTLVEIPEDVEVAPLLGAHHHCNFLIPPYNASSAISYIYEYNYIKKGPPERQSCWKPSFPSYESLRSDFAVKFPYPIPSPAPNPPDSLGNLAQPLPPHLIRRPDEPAPIFDRLSCTIPATSISTPSSHLSKSIPSPEHIKNLEFQSALYTPPTDLSKVHDYKQELVKPEIKQEGRVIIGKSDPYEDEEAATSLLRARDGIHSKPVKNEPSVDHAEEFLHSIIGVKKEEPFPHYVPPSPPTPMTHRKPSLKHDDNYEPSSDLLKLFATLPSDLVSGASTDPAIPNPVKVEDSVTNEYCPSDELLATFATLPAEFLNRNETNQDVKRAIKTEENPVKIRIKPEPIDDDIQLGGWKEESVPIERARSSTLATDGGTMEPQSRPSPAIRVKAEPHENSHLLMLPPTRDPRKRPQSTLVYKREETSSISSKPQDPRTRRATSPKRKLEAEPVDSTAGVTKRVKVEWD